MRIKLLPGTSFSLTATTLLSCCMLLSGCVQTPPVKQGDYALLISNYPIIKINGEVIKDETDDSYKQDIKAGENTAVIVYNTYSYDYFCSFTWTAEPRLIYEVTDQENIEPLTLYQWKRKNRLWAQRLDPIDPTHCERKPRPQTETEADPATK